MLREPVEAFNFISQESDRWQGLHGADARSSQLCCDDTRYRDIPHDVVQLARGFILDGLGVALAGSTDECCAHRANAYPPCERPR